VSQSLRNKIYATAAALIGVAVTLGFFAPEDADTALGLLSQVLDVAATVLALGTAVLAFVKSLPSKVTTIPVPAAEVDSVTKTDGTTVLVK
jgi:hypothetical protein